jgi:predicted HTH domain antitoxin
MHAVNVSTLKNNPAQALQWAQKEPVVVFNRDRPQAVLTEVNRAGGMDAPHVQRAMAAALFKDGGLSLVRAAKLAQCTLPEFLRYLALCNIPVIDMTEDELAQEFKTLDAWMAQNKA